MFIATCQPSAHNSGRESDFYYFLQTETTDCNPLGKPVHVRVHVLFLGSSQRRWDSMLELDNRK